jgi:hypothetical protein
MIRCKHICKPLQAQPQTKVCKRASTSATEKIIFNSFPSKNFKNANTQADTERQESKMTMIRKLNNDNGLQDWKTEHQAVTGGIFYCRVRGYFSVSASNKLSSNLTGQCFVIGNKNIPLSVMGKVENQNIIN